MSNADEALLKLGQSTGEAVSGVLEMFAPGQVAVGGVDVIAADHHPLEGISVPAVLTSVSYVDGVTGGNLFVMTVEGARRLAAAMMGVEPDGEAGAAELSELELSAVAEAMSKMMTGAAAAISAVLDSAVDIGPPETRLFESAGAAKGAYPSTPHVVRAAFSVCGEPCRLVQLVPSAFVVRLTHALEELASMPDLDGLLGGAFEPAPVAAAPSLRGIPVRVWAELGRAQLASAHVVGLGAGAVLELDRQVDEPIDLYVNGRRFATGRLVVADGADWAVRIEHVLGPENN